MKKVLRVSFPQKCIGCELCVMEVQKQLGKMGIEGSPIRVFKNREESILLDKIVYTLDIDPSVNDLNIQKVKNICPTGVFEIEEVNQHQEDRILQ